MNNNIIILKKLDKLSKSQFRRNFKLRDNDKEYILKQGLDNIINHAYDFIRKRLSSKIVINDGKQTPMKGHPIFIAQHATGTCCRGCLYKWHGINKNKELSDNEVNYIVSIIMTWIIKEMNN